MLSWNMWGISRALCVGKLLREHQICHDFRLGSVNTISVDLYRLRV